MVLYTTLKNPTYKAAFIPKPNWQVYCKVMLSVFSKALRNTNPATLTLVQGQLTRSSVPPDWGRRLGEDWAATGACGVHECPGYRHSSGWRTQWAASCAAWVQAWWQTAGSRHGYAAAWLTDAAVSLLKTWTYPIATDHTFCTACTCAT